MDAPDIPVGWGWKQAAVLSYLIEGGMVPSTYPVLRVPYLASGTMFDGTLSRRTVQNYNPLIEDPMLPKRLSRELRLVLEQPAWSRSEHRNFPPTFQAAVRAFLLAAAASARHRKQQQPPQQQSPPPQQQHGLHCAAEEDTEQAGPCLADLSAPLLERVLGLAAYPLSAWLALMRADAIV
ncbi:hypothetical protein N2152v2_000762 [Parachlorella kessleri]